MARKTITTTTYSCDICKVETESKDIHFIEYPVVFTTDQNDGRRREPYISKEKIDVCKECLKKICKVTAYGVQGYNTYSIMED